MTQTRYPIEVASVVRKNKTFAINSFLVKADGYEGESPYKTYGKFSRYQFSIVDFTSGERKTVTSNLRISDIPIIKEKSLIALEKNMFAMNDINNYQSKANTVKFLSGALKGKTPAQVILEGQKEEIIRQRNFLIANLNKYPGNRTILEAIDEAINLYKQNKLESNSISGQICIYNAGLHPLTRKKREDGYCQGYDMSILWVLGQSYPVTLEIKNFYADVVNLPDGRLNVRNIDKSSLLNLNISMTDAEWMNIVDSIERNLRMFEFLHAKNIFVDADTIYRSILNKEGHSL